jgi:FRG domain
MADHRVSSLRDAIELADEWRRSGSHAWFRGQNQASWGLVTSLARAQGRGSESRWQEQIAQFCHWLRSVPELKYLLEEAHVHEFFAVLQHYGIPTHYLDFTTNPQVAGFFAGAGNPNDIAPGTDGCIIALDPDSCVDMLRTVAEIRSFAADAWPEQVTVHVDNLWRLEAQSGHFIYLPTAGIENVVELDRIVFTHDASAPPFTRNDIYPARKSPLETRLDEFFTMQLMVDNQEYFRGFFDALKTPNKFWISYARPDSASYLVPGTRPDPSWERAAEGWSTYHVEALRDVRSGDSVDLPVHPASPEVATIIDSLMRERLEASDSVRGKALDFRIVPEGGAVPDGWVAFVERAVARAWDGVRRLPYTNAQVAATVARTVAFACADMSASPAFGIRDFKARFGLDVGIELADRHDTTARAVCAEDSYLDALRRDIEDVIVDDLRSRPRRQLLQVLAPPDLFDFDRLVDLFACEIVPTEVLIQGGDLAVFYSPARPVIIGAA